MCHDLIRDHGGRKVLSYEMERGFENLCDSEVRSTFFHTTGRRCGRVHHACFVKEVAMAEVEVESNAIADLSLAPVLTIVRTGDPMKKVSFSLPNRGRQHQRRTRRHNKNRMP